MQHHSLGLRTWLRRVSGTPLPLVALIAVVAIANLVVLVRIPPPFVDDAWYASRGWALIHTGRPFGTLDSGVFDRYQGYWTYIPWLGAWFVSLSIRVLGLSLFSVRLVSLILALLLLSAVYVFTKDLYGPRVGLLAVLMTSLSGPFLYSAHVARPDVGVAAFGFAAVALTTTDRSTRFAIKSLLSGLAVALAFELHPNGMLYGPAVVALYLSAHGKSLFRSRRFWTFAIGLGVGLVLYLAIHVLPYPQTYWTLTRVIYGPWRIPPLLATGFTGWLDSLVEVLMLLGTASALRAAVTAAGLVALARRRAAGDRKALFLLAALILSFAALVRHKLPYFAIELTPAADILLAAFVGKLLHDGRQMRARPRLSRVAYEALVVLVVVLLTGAAALAWAPASQDPTADYQAVVERIRQTVPPDSTLMGSQTYWFDFPNLRYYSWENLVYYQRSVPGTTLAAALTALHPGYLLIDGHLQEYVTYDRRQLTEYQQFLYVPRAELEGFLGMRAHLAAMLRTNTYGVVRIYRIDWD